jgi:hypothetical protein
MPDWWEQPYKLGPPVPVPGFPRPLYPPDAAEAGRVPSVNGPDVEAYKRTVWRAGRWPGPASSFDRAYSNKFAHGGPNVVNTGVSGVQRQMGIDDTGWIGKATFDVLRAIRCPAGPHAGQLAMDAYAQSLIVVAWEQFGGKEPPPEPEVTLRSKALARAVTQIGTKESPAHSNQAPYTHWYGMTGPWCAMFVTWCYEQAGNSPSFRRGETYAYVPYIVSDSRNYRNGLAVTVDPLPGDPVSFDWDGGAHDHVGLFERWLDRGRGKFSTVEGNTSSDAHGDQSNGGEVCRKTRTLGSGVVFTRVAEP